MLVIRNSLISRWGNFISFFSENMCVRFCSLNRCEMLGVSGLNEMVLCVSVSGDSVVIISISISLFSVMVSGMNWFVMQFYWFCLFVQLQWWNFRQCVRKDDVVCIIELFIIYKLFVDIVVRVNEVSFCDLGMLFFLCVCLRCFGEVGLVFLRLFFLDMLGV